MDTLYKTKISTLLRTRKMVCNVYLMEIMYVRL